MTRIRPMCSLPDCDKPHSSLGYCKAHAAKQRRYGDPRAVRMGRGELNPNWSGEEVGYIGAHKRVYRKHGSAKQHECADCSAPADQWSYNHDDPIERTELVNGTTVAFSTDPNHYSPRCFSCHTKLDRYSERISA